ncbi:MAG: type II toxin-antitoxin system RelE/ParE family toxin [Planctomycetota bacterium]
MIEVRLTRRAIRDIEAIDRHSIEKWGRRVASKYLSDLQSGMARLLDSPGLLQKRPESSLRLRFYPVREHMLICDRVGDRILVLAVRHLAMDLPGRVAELEPTLILESELLAKRLEQRES